MTLKMPLKCVSGSHNQMMDSNGQVDIPTFVFSWIILWIKALYLITVLKKHPVDVVKEKKALFHFPFSSVNLPYLPHLAYNSRF